MLWCLVNQGQIWKANGFMQKLQSRFSKENCRSFSRRILCTCEFKDKTIFIATRSHFQVSAYLYIHLSPFHCTKVYTGCVLNPLRYTWGYDSCFFPDCFKWFTLMASCIKKLFLFLKNLFVFFKGIKTHFKRFLVRFLFSLNKNRDPLFLSLSIRQTQMYLAFTSWNI